MVGFSVPVASQDGRVLLVQGGGLPEKLWYNLVSRLTADQPIVRNKVLKSYAAPSQDKLRHNHHHLLHLNTVQYLEGIFLLSFNF